MDSQIEEIKNKLNIVEIIGSYVKLSKTGANYRGVCPFHSEKGPSFFVSPARQIWHCFGCGAGHSIFDFIMKIEGVEFGDALKMMAQKAGVQLKRENPELKTARQRLYEICELACCFFEKQVEFSVVGKEAKDYLLKRGITEQSIKKWRLGYSPDTWQGLSEFLISKGYRRDEIIRAGLAVEKEDKSNSYDRFRGRIVFPIFDANSQVIGFGARVFKVANEKETAKYINTPQTLLYDKSNVLYGINNAKLAIRKNNQCVLTEGYTDAIMCHQAGFENTVAVSGTALTPNHLNILKRYTENLLLSFDMDVAGDNATKRGINLAENQGFNIKIIDTYSNAKDPAEIILENPQNWENAVKNARAIMDYYFDTALSHFDKTSPQGKKEISKIILPAIKRLPNKIEQSHWIQKLSQKIDIREDAIIEELKKINAPAAANSGNNKKWETENNLSEAGRKKLIEEKVVSLILKDPENINVVEDSCLYLFSEKTCQFLKSIKEVVKNTVIQPPEEAVLASENTAGKVEAVFADLPQEKKNITDAVPGNFMAALSLKAEIEYDEDGGEEVQLCILQLKNIELKNKLHSLSDQIKEAERAGDMQKVNTLVAEFTKLSKGL